MSARTHVVEKPMKTWFRLASIAAFAAACWPATALADGSVLAPADLPAAARAALVRDVAAARAADPAPFAALDALRAGLPEADARKRGPVVPLTRAMVDLRSLPALLEAIALDDAPRGDLTDAAWNSWRVSLLEAAGRARDPRAADVLRAALERTKDPALLRAAAVGLGQLRTDEGTRLLVTLAQGADARADAAVAGLGESRRPDATQALADQFAQLPGAARAELLARALGDAGSSWAWQALLRGRHGADPKAADATRKIALEALVKAFVPYGGKPRQRIEAALVVLDHPDAAVVIERAKAGQDAAAVAALDALAKKLAARPLQRR